MIVNIETFSEADFKRTFVYKTSGDSPSPIDLAGAKLQMMVRQKRSSAAVLIEMSTENERITVNYDNTGEFSIRIPYSELSKLSEGIYVHSLVAIWTTDGSREQIWRGTMTHQIGATR